MRDLFRRTGRLAPKQGLIVPQLRNFRVGSAEASPPVVDNCTGVDWRMFLNDTLSCCGMSALAGGILQRTTKAQGAPLIMPDDVVRSNYFKLSGGTDSGLILTDVLNWFSTTGVALRDQSLEIGLWAQLDHTNQDELRRAIYEFGSIYVGWALPQNALSTNDWSDTSQQGVDGHCTLMAGYNKPKGIWTCPTWAEEIPATDAFVAKYLFEAFVVWSPGEGLSTKGVAPNGYDFQRLQTALTQFAA